MRGNPGGARDWATLILLQFSTLVAGIGGQAGSASQLRGETRKFFPENLGMRLSIWPVSCQMTKDYAQHI